MGNKEESGCSDVSKDVGGVGESGGREEGGLAPGFLRGAWGTGGEGPPEQGPHPWGARQQEDQEGAGRTGRPPAAGGLGLPTVDQGVRRASWRSRASGYAVWLRSHLACAFLVACSRRLFLRTAGKGPVPGPWDIRGPPDPLSVFYKTRTPSSGEMDLRGKGTGLQT